VNEPRHSKVRNDKETKQDVRVMLLFNDSRQGSEGFVVACEGWQHQLQGQLLDQVESESRDWCRACQLESQT